MNTNSRVAVVTGGTGGLGTAICRRLAAGGLRVVALHTPGNSQVPAWRAAQEAAGCPVDAFPADVASFDSCAAALQTVRERHGPVSVLVNNAGVTRDATFRKMTLQDWELVLQVNLHSMFNLTKQVVEDMVAQGWGRIVNISSVNGQRGAFGQANYAAAKAGIIGFTRTLALELARKNVTVNTVSPGYLRTKMVEQVSPQVLQDHVLPEIPLGRLGDPDEVAQLVAYLCSDAAAFVTGANLAINGGQHMA